MATDKSKLVSGKTTGQAKTIATRKRSGGDTGVGNIKSGYAKMSGGKK